MVETVLVLDVGTSSTKAVLFGRDGAVIAAAEAPYDGALLPHRQDVAAWWGAACRAVAALGPVRPDAVALAGTMENLVAVDDAGAPVFDAILYSDPCGAASLEAARAKLDALGAAAILGNAPEPLMTAFKIGWLRDNAAGAFAAARWFLPGAKDALLMRMTGRAVTDPVTATTTGLMDLASRGWSTSILELLDIPSGKLPEILPAGAIVGALQPAAAAALGLGAGIPVVNGCGDGGATTLGSSGRAEGDISLYLGTTGWLARVVQAPKSFTPRPVYRLAHPSPGLIIEITPILSAGAAGNWIRSILCLSEADRDTVLAKADEQPSDLVFLPYLAGERFPFFDAAVRGAFFGLDAGHGAGDLYYAVLEGVAFAIAANLAAIDPDGGGRLTLCGGGAASAVWPRMIADVLQRPLSIPASAGTATAAGAFMIAAETFGLSAATGGEERSVTPRPERAERIARQRAAFGRATGVARQRAVK